VVVHAGGITMSWSPCQPLLLLRSRGMVLTIPDRQSESVKMIPRTAAARLTRLLQGFPVVTVTGPRQSGKTTLVRALLPDRPYVSLESPAQREFAR
jgi:predicted AAA+ superfamily ATPase